MRLLDYTPDRREACLELIRAGHDPLFTRERFAWLHEQGPLGPSAIALCMDGEQVVGIYSVMRKNVLSGDTSYHGGRDVDPVVHPNYRGRGIFTGLLQYGLENFREIDFFFNFANPAAARGFTGKGWREIGPLEDRVCQLGGGRLLSRDGLVWLASGAWAPRRPDPEAREITSAQARALLDALPTTPVWRPDGRLWVERSPAYLAWRYLHHPLHTYRWFLLGDTAAPRSLAVIRVHADERRIFVLDLLGLSESESPSLKTWLPLWARLFPGAWVGTWSTLPAGCRPHFTRNPLRRGQGAPFLVRAFPGRTSPAELTRCTSWFLTHGDLEIA